jgi:thiol-disulfide isomerase/thioredoxin
MLGALALALCGSLLPVRAGTLAPGDAFPDLAAFDLEGKLPDLRVAKIVLVDFWASWCAPCKASFPAMEELYHRYGKDGLVVVAVNLDDKRTAMEGFLRKNRASFPVVRDAGNKLVAKVNIASMPTSFLLDSEGKVRAVHSGFRGEDTKAKYVKEIEELLQITLAKAKS